MQNRLLPSFLRPSLVSKIARSSGWLARKQRTFSPPVFVEALVASVSCGYCSFREIATEIGLLTGKTISKQALSERFNAKGVQFLKQIVTEALREAVHPPFLNALGKLPDVRRILIGDSSSIALHPSLVEHFPGSSNQSGVQSAQLKFQFTFDLLSGQWLETGLKSYLIPDQSSASNILSTVLQAGDLIIRDLGYMKLDTFDAIGKLGAYYISRFLHGTALFSPDKQELSLYDLARARTNVPGNTFSMDVLLGAKKQLACRLVIIRVPQKIANERRRKLKAKAKRKGCPAPQKSRLALQDWSFYITNLSETQAGDTQLFELYQLRWRVENIFRIAKSQTSLLKIARHRTNPHHAEMLLWAWMLLMISMSKQGVFRLLEHVSDDAAPEVVTNSIFKGIERILGWIAPSIELAATEGDFGILMDRLRMQQRYHDQYEKRSRISMPDRVARALGLQSKLSLT